MRLATLNFIMLIFSFSGCNKPEKEKVINNDDYGEYEIADPQPSKQGSEPKLHVVEIIQMKFVPDVLNISRGDTVVWINKDIVQHDVAELNTDLWNSTRLASGASWKMVFTKSQLYHCSLHVVMKAKIIVDGNDIAMMKSPVEITMCSTR
jgi:plastocyanin